MDVRRVVVVVEMRMKVKAGSSVSFCLLAFCTLLIFFLFTGILYLINSGMLVEKSVTLKVCPALYHFCNKS